MHLQPNLIHKISRTSEHNPQLSISNADSWFAVRRTLKGGIVDEEGNNLQMVLAEHASTTKDQPDSSPPQTFSKRRSSSGRHEASPHSHSVANGYSPVNDKPQRVRGSITARYKHIATWAYPLVDSWYLINNQNFQAKSNIAHARQSLYCYINAVIPFHQDVKFLVARFSTRSFCPNKMQK